MSLTQARKSRRTEKAIWQRPSDSNLHWERGQSFALPGSRLSWALRKAQQVVRLLAIGIGLQIFVAKAADSYDHPHGSTTSLHVEGILAVLDTGDGIRLGILIFTRSRPSPSVRESCPDTCYKMAT